MSARSRAFPWWGRRYRKAFVLPVLPSVVYADGGMPEIIRWLRSDASCTIILNLRTGRQLRVMRGAGISQSMVGWVME